MKIDFFKEICLPLLVLLESGSADEVTNSDKSNITEHIRNLIKNLADLGFAISMQSQVDEATLSRIEKRESYAPIRVQD